MSVAIFAVKVEDNFLVRRFMHDTDERLNAKGFVNYLVKGGVTKYDTEHYIIEYEITFFKIYYVGVVWVIAAFVLSQFSWTWWQIPGILFLLSYLLWDSKGLFLMTLLGLRKAGYKEKIQLVTNDTLLSMLLSRIKPTLHDENTKVSTYKE
jgi:hypothetical protein